MREKDLINSNYTPEELDTIANFRKTPSKPNPNVVHCNQQLAKLIDKYGVAITVGEDPLRARRRCILGINKLLRQKGIKL